MEREAYRRGVRALKSLIKELAEKQRGWKRIMRLPRKTKEDKQKLQAEVDRVMPPKENYGYDVSWIQCRVAARKLQISAYLNVYAEVRGKSPCHSPTRWGSVNSWSYGHFVQKAKEAFEEACATTSEQCSAP